MVLLEIEAIGAEREGEVITVPVGGTSFNLGSPMEHALQGFFIFYQKPLDVLQKVEIPNSTKSILPIDRDTKINTGKMPLT